MTFSASSFSSNSTPHFLGPKCIGMTLSRTSPSVAFPRGFLAAGLTTSSAGFGSIT